MSTVVGDVQSIVLHQGKDFWVINKFPWCAVLPRATGMVIPLPVHRLCQQLLGERDRKRTRTEAKRGMRSAGGGGRRCMREHRCPEPPTYLVP